LYHGYPAEFDFRCNDRVALGVKEDQGEAKAMSREALGIAIARQGAAGGEGLSSLSTS
jgi:hypothetical protein